MESKHDAEIKRLEEEAASLERRLSLYLQILEETQKSKSDITEEIASLEICTSLYIQLFEEVKQTKPTKSTRNEFQSLLLLADEAQKRIKTELNESIDTPVQEEPPKQIDVKQEPKTMHIQKEKPIETTIQKELDAMRARENPTKEPQGYRSRKERVLAFLDANKDGIIDFLKTYNPNPEYKNRSLDIVYRKTRAPFIPIAIRNKYDIAAGVIGIAPPLKNGQKFGMRLGPVELNTKVIDIHPMYLYFTNPCDASDCLKRIESEFKLFLEASPHL